MKSNHYSPAEVTVIGRAQDVVRGSRKGIFFDDGPGQDRRTIIIEVVE